MGMSTKERVAQSEAFNAAVVEFVRVKGQATNAQLREKFGEEAKALRAKLSRMMRAGTIHSRAVSGRRGHHVTYHVGPGPVSANTEVKQTVVSNWQTRAIPVDPLTAALFAGARRA